MTGESGTPRPPQVWELAVHGHAHRVEASGSVRRRVRWSVDGVQVAERTSADANVKLEGGTAYPGSVRVRFSGLGAPRRATLLSGDEKDARSLAALGGIDLDPAPGSPAAAHEDRVRARPAAYAAIAAAGGVVRVVLPILLTLVAVRVAFTIPWPDWSIPTPDLPRIPWPQVDWPDLPSIPWPDWTLPGWLAWILDNLHFVVPVILALVFARGEIVRRRKQDQLKATLRDGAQQPAAETSDEAPGT